MINKNKLSIIIITLNEEKNLPKLMDCLRKQTFQDFEIIIVDSNSQDKTQCVAECNSKYFKEFKFHKMKNRGASLGRNTGAKLAKYEKILFLDADVQFKENFLKKLTYLSNKKQAKIASVYIKLNKFNLLHSVGYYLTNLGFFATQFFSPTAVGACILSSKTIHKKINGFDEEIYLCEDCDYVKRASKLSKFRMLPMTFYFDNRRMEFEGSFKTFNKYLKANFTRFIFGQELKKVNCNIEYKFGHYEK